MKKKIIILCLIFLCSFLCYQFSKDKNYKKQSNTNELTTTQKIQDFHYMYNLLKDNFADFEITKEKYNYDWLSHKTEFEKIIKNTKNNKEFYTAINEILNKLNQCHTRFLGSNDFKYYRELFNKYASSYGTSRWAKVTNNPKAVKLYTSNKISFDIDNSKSNNSTDEKESPSNYNAKIIEQGKIAYLKIYSMGDEYVEKDKNPVYEFLKTVSSYPYLIIDIQGNGGGNADYWTNNIVSPLINSDMSYLTCDLYKGGEYSMKFYKDRLASANYKIENISSLPDNIQCPPYAKKEFKYYSIETNTINSKNYVGFKGKIFLLVDKGDFSSSEAFAVFSKTTKWATFVGTNTGGDGIGTDPIVAVLPNSGLVFSFSGEMGVNDDGKPNSQYGTSPDIYVEGTTNDCIEAIKKYIINKK